jgi:uncharacterized protein YprB with RNaseH-like and TPR domain
LGTSLQAQLELLRKRMDNVNARFVGGETEAKRVADVSCLGGQEVETELGRHWEIVRHYSHDHIHGHVKVERLQELAGRKWVYLDTETTGLAGGSGTLAFLIGVARVTEDGFELRQWFVREHGEEASALHALGRYLGAFDTLVTYNGRSYDQPLLETRYTLARQRTPFSKLEHMDLLFGARRLWKLRFESCRLVELEKQILGHERVGDVPGEMIPHLYFEFLRTGNALRLKPVFEHNALDLLSLAFLAGIVPAAFENPLEVKLQHGAELRGVARWLAAEGRLDESAELYRRAANRSISDELTFDCLWELSLIEKKQKRLEAALILWSELAQCRSSHQAEALVELAKYYEHTEKNPAMALECTLAACAVERSVDLAHRRMRLEAKLEKRAPQRLL